MTTLLLPHLRANEPATFLAGIGVLSLVTVELGDSTARLCWPEGPRGAASLDTVLFGELSGLSEGLRGIAQSMIDKNELLPEAGEGFPPRKEGKESDPTRTISRQEAASWARLARQEGRARAWLAGIVATNDVVNAKDGKGRGTMMGRNPVFDAGPGTVSMSGTLAKSRAAAAEDGALHEALLSGARRRDSIGGYLDWRADRDAADLASKRDPSNFGDSVVAWLAFMALRCAPVVSANGVVGSALCPPRRVPPFRKPLVWPVWTTPIDLDAITVLLAHPAIQPVPGRADPGSDTAALRALGVCALFASSRLAKGNNDGAYGPATELWART